MSAVRTLRLPNDTLVAEDHNHVCFLRSDGSVAVYRYLGVLLGVGRWENGIIVGSGVNCGVLVNLEATLRELTGTP